MDRNGNAHASQLMDRLDRTSVNVFSRDNSSNNDKQERRALRAALDGDSRQLLDDLGSMGSMGSLKSRSTDSRMSGADAGGAYAGYSPLELADREDQESNADESFDLTHGDVEFMQKWLEAADNGELDIYTCLALSDMSTWSTDTRDLLLNVICVLIVQGVVPYIMLKTELGEKSGAEEPAIEYRICGTIIYLYAVWTIYRGSTDECRSLVVDRGFECGVPLHFLLPAVFGEVMNAIVGCTLTLSLFVIFTSSQDITELVMNAVAINFLALVDSEFVELEHKKLAKRNISVISEKWTTSGMVSSEQCCRQFFLKVLQVSLDTMRIAGILLFGLVLAVIFMSSHEPLVCERLALADYLEPFGLCDPSMTELPEHSTIAQHGAALASAASHVTTTVMARMAATAATAAAAFHPTVKPMGIVAPVTTTLTSLVAAGSWTIPVAACENLAVGMMLTLSGGGNAETKTIVDTKCGSRRLASVSRRLAAGTVIVDSPLRHSYARGTSVTAHQAGARATKAVPPTVQHKAMEDRGKDKQKLLQPPVQHKAMEVSRQKDAHPADPCAPIVPSVPVQR